MPCFKKLLLIAVASVTVAVGSGSDTYGQATRKIMPLGDSITRGDGGSTPFHGYRNTLFFRLSDSGYNPDFVGTLKDGVGFDNDHQGVAGAQASQLANNINAYLQSTNPDMVLLHTGTNDINSNVPVATIIKDIERLIDNIYNFNNGITILHSTIVPRADNATRNERTIELNGEIKQLVARKSGLGYNIRLVDNYAVFVNNTNWKTEYMNPDGFHPNDTGYEAMSESWFNAVQNSVNGPVARFVDNFNRATLGSEWVGNAAFAIQNNELANTATVESWNYISAYIGRANPVEVGFRWSTTADNQGIENGGFALLLAGPAASPNGYMLWRRPSNNTINLWTLNNGAPEQSVEAKTGLLPAPKPGDSVSVVIKTSPQAHTFEFYINGVLDGTVSDPQKRRGNGETLYAGVILHGNRKNNLDNFTVAIPAGTPGSEIVDDFNRTGPGLGTNWDADEAYQIVNNQMSNTATSGGWRLATWKRDATPSEVGFNWGTGADADGISEGGVALRLDKPAKDASGYLAWIFRKGKRLRLFTIVNGAPGQQVQDVPYTGPDPVAGDVFTVQVGSDASGHYFDYFVNGEKYGRTVDPQKRLGNGAPLYSGVMVSSNLNNDIDNFRFIANTDRTPPAAVNDLAVTGAGGTSITLGWTAPGGDGNTGQAASYEMRYSTEPITTANFEQATRVPSMPSPSPAGARESVTVAGLSASTTYYFRLRATDGVGNVSGLSNEANGSTSRAAGIVDNFNRTALGPNWAANPAFAIVNNELANTATVEAWNYVATYTGKKNPVEVGFRWSTTANTAGIENGGFALMLDGPSATPNGYMLWRRPSNNSINLWTMANGAPETSVEVRTGNLAAPKAGDSLSVVIKTTEDGHFFDLYINGTYDGTVGDRQKRRGNGDALYAGVILHGNRSNNLDNFTIVTPVGGPSVLAKVSGDNQQAQVGTKLAEPLIVRVEDDNGNPIEGAQVRYSVTLGNGELVQKAGIELRVDMGSNQPYVDTDGLEWKADVPYSAGNYGYQGGQPGNVFSTTENIINRTDDKVWQTERYGLTAFRADVPNDTYSVTLHFAELAYSEAGKRRFGVRIEGNTVLNNFDPFADAGGRFIVVSKRFTVPVSDGRVDIEFLPNIENPNILAIEILGSEVNAVTDANGQVGREFIVGSSVGRNEVTVSPVGFTAPNVVFSAFGNAGAATQIKLISGNNQSAAAGSTLPQPLVVEVTDAQGNPSFNYPVKFVVTQGGGSVSAVEAQTGENGRASVTWTIGNQSETNRVEAIAAGLTGSPVVFTATATSGIGQQLASVSGNNQTGTVATPLANPIVVRVVDKNNQPVANFPAGFYVRRGGGSTSKNAPVRNAGFEQPFAASANNIGNVGANWTATNSDNSQTHSESTGRDTGKKAQRMNTTGSATFAEIAQLLQRVPQNGARVRLSLLYKTEGSAETAIDVWIRKSTDPAARMLELTYGGSSGSWRQVNHDFDWNASFEPVELVVRARDGVQVDIDAISIGHLTDSQGLLSATWTLGDTAMVQEVQAVAFREGEPLLDSAVNFQATARAGLAQVLAYVSGRNQTGSSGQPLLRPFRVRVEDTSGNGISNHPVSFRIVEGGGQLDGSLSSVTKNSDANGFAEVILTLGTITGQNNRVEATATRAGSPLTGSPVLFDALAATPSKLEMLSGNNQVGSATQPLEQPLKVLILDDENRPISGFRIVFTVTEGGGTINGRNSADIFTDENGEAAATLVMGPTPGSTNMVTASAVSGGQPLAGSPQVFTATSVELSSLQLVDGNGQTGTVGGILPSPLKVKVIDALGKGIKGWPVQFAVKAGGGSFANGDTLTTVNTDSIGVASVNFKLGSKPGSSNNRVEATASYLGNPLSGTPVIFEASANVGTAVSLLVAGGNKQRGVVGLPLPEPLQAKVADALGNGIAGYEVTFEVKSGGGKVDGVALKKVLTNAEGIASVSLTVGTTAGVDNNVIEARAFSGTTPLGNSPLLFTASATSSSARNIEYVSGTGQQGVAGEALAQELVVKVTDASAGRNPVAEHPVIFTITGGGGTLNGAEKAEVVVSTDASGLARASWRLGGVTAPDSQRVQASSTDGQAALSGSPVRFAAVARAGKTSPTASIVDATGPVKADGKEKSFVTVSLRDAFGNPVVGHAVSVLVSGEANNISQPLSFTDNNGRVTASFTSTRAELKTVTAFDINNQIEVTNGDTVQFLPLEAQRLLAEAGNGQTGNVSTALKEPLIAKVTDTFGNPVRNWPVTFSVTAGGGYFLENPTQVTDASGLARITFVLGPTPGSNAAQAVAANLNVPPVNFTAIGKVGTATTMTPLPGTNGQTGVAGELIPIPVGVKITDASGDPIFGHNVQFRVNFGGGTVNGAAEITVASNAQGIARVNWRLGADAGQNIIEAIAPALGNAKEIFTAIGVGGAPAHLVLVGSNRQSGVVTGRAPNQLQVRVTDINNNPVRGFNVNFKITKGTGSLSSTQRPTDGAGIASVSFVFGDDVGERIVRAWGDGLRNSPINFFLDGRASTPTTITVLDGNNIRGTMGKRVSRSTRILVKDALGNPVPDVQISMLPISGNGGFVEGQSVMTDERGIGKATWVLATDRNENKAWAIVTGLPQVELNATGLTNNFPVFQEIAAPVVNEGETVVFDVRASDDDNDPLTYGARNLPNGATFDSLVTRTFTWRTGSSSAGYHEVVFTANDGRGGVSEKLVVIKVNNLNRSPQLSNWQPANNTLSLETGTSQLFQLAATDSDGDEIGYLWYLGNRHVASASTFLYQPINTGSQVLTALAFDEQDTVRISWTLSVAVSVELASFTASVEAGDGVKLQWVTVRETDNIGFNILRSQTQNGVYEVLNDKLIPPSPDGHYGYRDKDVQNAGRYYYKLEDVSASGQKTHHGPILAEIALPETYDLAQNFPNPFNPSTNIRFQLPKPGQVTLRIYNVLGQEVRTLLDKEMAAGFHTALWDGRNNHGVPVTSGVYYYRIQAGDYAAAKKMLMLK